MSNMKPSRSQTPRLNRRARKCSKPRRAVTPLRRDVDKLREDVDKLMEGKTT